jgi:hypothetical protein
LLRSVTGQTSLVGTNGATFYITGVQLEVGSTATSFDYRPYGTELALCQRYYYRIKVDAVSRLLAVAGQCASSVGGFVTNTFPVTMRTRPTALEQSGTASHYNVLAASSSGVTCNSVPAYNTLTTENTAFTEFGTAGSLAAGNATSMYSNNASAYLGWSAEL